MSTVSPKVRAGRSLKGWALYARAPIAAEEVIVELDGPIVERNTETSIQIGEGVYMDGNGDIDDYINHACRPNGYVCFADMSFRALRPIAVGEEITYNYNSTEFDMEEGFICRCGAEDCLGLVQGFRYLDRQQRLALRPWLSPYLLAKLETE
jgi:SET domain-containing protein